MAVTNLNHLTGHDHSFHRLLRVRVLPAAYLLPARKKAVGPPAGHASTPVSVLAAWIASLSEQSPSAFSSSFVVLTVVDGATSSLRRAPIRPFATGSAGREVRLRRTHQPHRVADLDASGTHHLGV